MNAQLLAILACKLHIGVHNTRNLLWIQRAKAVNDIEHIRRGLPQYVECNLQVALLPVRNRHDIAAHLIALSLGIFDHVCRRRNGIQISCHTNQINRTF